MIDESKVIVFVLPRSPWPPFAGQSRLSFYRAKELKKLGYKIILIAISSSKELNKNTKVKLNDIFHEVHFIKVKKIDFIFIFLNSVSMRLLKNLPLQNSWLNSQRIIKSFEKKLIILEKKYTNMIFHFYSIRTYSLWFLMEVFKKPFFVDLVDSMTLNIKSKIFSNKEKIKQIFWNFEYRSIINFERNLPTFDYCKGYLLVSEIDKKIIRLENYNPDISIIVNNIGCEIPQKLNIIERKSKNIIFFGSLNYEPNISAIKWLLNYVMPIVWSKDSSIIINIAGRSPTKELIKISKKEAKIKVIPNPKSMNKIMNQSIIAVAPLISGSGQQFKIIEAMANGLPVIASSKVASPFGFIDKKDLLIEDDHIKFADAIVNLSKDSKIRGELTKNAFLKIKDKYSWESSVKNLKNIYEMTFNL